MMILMLSTIILSFVLVKSQNSMENIPNTQLFLIVFPFLTLLRSYLQAKFQALLLGYHINPFKPQSHQIYLIFPSKIKSRTLSVSFEKIEKILVGKYGVASEPISNSITHYLIIIFQGIPKKMNLSQSQSTETTKKSQLKIPLLQSNPESFPAQVTIFTEKSGKRYKLLLPFESRTINELILEAARQFNLKFELGLKTDTSCYFLYAAKKNGKMESDYPALDPSQSIILTKVTYFYLKDKAPDVKMTQIKSNFGWERKNEIKSEKRTFCPCLFGL